MTEISQIPNGPHYAIVRSVSVQIPGDERSREAPGHGYAASIEYYSFYEAYTDKKEWETAIKRLSSLSQSFRAFSVKPATVSTIITVEE